MNCSIGNRSRRRAAGAVFLAFFSANLASANRISETGTLSSPEDTVLITLQLNAGDDLLLNTYGFGGGTNYAGAVIPSGGFDPFVGLFSGTGSTALFINGDSDILSDFSPGCPPAGLVTVGSVPDQCSDVILGITGLTAGTYTIVLSDGAYVPEAVFESAPAYLGDGFVDLTGGAFQTCYDAADCNNDTGNWALDISAPEGSFKIITPEPAPFGPVGFGLAIVAGLALSKRKVTFYKFN
jgi:hypothetical protein